MNIVLTPELLGAIAGIVLSLLFSYIPGLSTKFASLKPEIKRLIMAGLIVVSSGIVFAAGCAGWIETNIVCDRGGAIQLLSIVISALIANQSTYAISPQTEAVKAAKSQ